ncbi:ECT2, partial [Cervus elaphus hippelaphus]
ENLIYTADPESFEVNTKDMDSTLSRASRAIKKTSKKVTRAFSFSKTPKRALRRALMASQSSAEGRSPSSNEKHVMSRLASTSSLAENLIYTADPESFEVNTKDMDSTLSRASRAIKKTSKK